ncbi:receptor-type tyrosine-protein phosphatase N2 isoform X2 [Ambystoma mexicanum]|uniref:receptor-type tyrosine-protein phosphatase N2 isoform X2 n=1 Tax=Ambystoma mexicanum TaxID=8296 RepID=UPI0037E7C733
MKLPSCLLLLLSASLSPFPARADWKYGCLFEDDLCKPFEVCLNDGVFGRCQRVPVIDVFKYEVSPPVLQRLRIILQKLSQRGLTWKNDYTQRVIASELSKLGKMYSRLSDPTSTDGSNMPRVSKQTAEGERNYELEKDVNFAKSLQQYLKYIGILSQPSPPNAYQRTKPEKPPVQNDDVQPDHFLDFTRPKAPGKTQALVFRPLPLQKYPAKVPPKTISQPPPDHPATPPGTDVDRKSLIEALKVYLSQKTPAQNLDTQNPSGRAKIPYIYPHRLRPPQMTSFGGLQRAGARVLPRPGAGTLIYKAKPRPGDVKDPLSAVDETFIQNVVKELGKRKVNIDHLSPKELDELADVIADTLQVVDAKEGQNGKAEEERGEQDMKRVVAPGFQENQDGLTEVENTEGEDRNEEADTGEEEQKSLNAKLADFLHEPAETESTMATEFVSENPFKGELKKSEESFYSSSEEENGERAVGIENVKSHTFTSELTASKKMASQMDSSELDTVQQWMDESMRQDGGDGQGPQQKTDEGLQLEVKSLESDQYGYILTQKESLQGEKGLELIENVAAILKLQMSDFSDVNVMGSAVTFQVHANAHNITTTDVANAAADHKEKLEKVTGLKILQTGTGEKSQLQFLPRHSREEDSTKFIVLTLISISCIVGVLAGSGVIYCLRHRSHHKLKEKLSSLGSDASADATAAYQELCRQRMSVKSSDRPEPLHTSRINSVSSQFSDGPMPSPSARSSTSSWCEEPVQSNMDISTGHMILSYMEDHLKNKNRLEREWEALCAYQAEPNAMTIALKEENVGRNRSQTVVTYDHSRLRLKVENSHDNSDYINASPIMDHDPRNPAYIATQGPLPATVADFWQMVWENGCVVIVMLTPLSENGVKQCHHYWPDEGSNLYHIYEVNLVSEHIWCEDFLVRSFYLKNLQTNETRTVTQFNFLNWNNQGVPSSTRSLLDFRRKVNKCYRGRSCPIIVHCSDGAGRSGTYILIDMVLNKMAKGAKEIDIAATLEHLRDQRPGMVQTKEQFEFALTAVAEEVNAILKALPQ